ncbi:hypothetical protein DFH07DRAFT_812067 [Mycena maculata]|uniref:Uncharacterized protein n=1 Tax=Mycena maculata TaxID=230809 RepID=A0AAD7JIM4_9AGAR|nr:hypothetical protein DFH07DRAFT_812067 [Mycena maculata]
MATPNASFNVHSSTVYRYAIVGVLGTVALIGVVLFMHSRVVERRRARYGPVRVSVMHGTALPEKPTLCEAYLATDHEKGTAAWDATMPLSLRTDDIRAPNLMGKISLDKDVVSTLLTVMMLIEMPSSLPPPSSEDGGDHPLPYLEIGSAGVEFLYTHSDFTK